MLDKIKYESSGIFNTISGEVDSVDVRVEHFKWLIEQAEKVEKLQEQLNAKIMFVSNGMEEEQYVLQEKVIKYEKALKDIEECNGILDIYDAKERAFKVLESFEEIGEE